MSKDKSHKVTSEKELLDYLEGKVTGSEANRIERQLLNSSFEEDAFEGLSGHIPMEIKEDLALLKQRIESKKNYKKPGFLSIAATIAFLITAFGSVWFVMENAFPNSELTLKLEEDSVNQESQLADHVEGDLKDVPDESEPADIGQEDAAEIASDIGQISEDITAEPDVATEETGDPEEGAGSGQLALNEQEPEQALTQASSRSEEAEPEELAQQEIASDNLDTSEASRARESAAAPVQVQSAFSEQEEAKTVSGTVYYQEDGEPLPGVTVSLGDQRAVTGLRGTFELSGANANAGDQLGFSSAGIISKTVTLEGFENVNTVVSPAPAGNQKAVILGYSSNNIKSPEPANGRTAFVDYVNSTLQYPEAARDQQIEGVVLLKVTISSDGAINNVEIKKSLSYGCDQEAIRLIREGPQWTPSLYNGEPVEGSVRVRIIFDL